MALVGGLNDGKRQIIGYGNAGTRTRFTIKGLSADSTYYWSVQAIDHAFAGSSFAPEQSFVAVDTNQPPITSFTASPIAGLEPLRVCPRITSWFVEV